MFTFQKFDDNRVISGYGAITLVKEQDATKYSLFLPGETVPCPLGSQDSFDYDILQSTTKGKVKGKMTIDDKEVEFMLHRDNVYRLNQLVGKVLDFLYVTADYMALKYTGTITYRPNDATADILKGTYTLTASSCEDKISIMDVRSLYMDTVAFTDVVPSSLTIGSEETIILIATDPKDAKIAATCDNENFEITPTEASGNTPAKLTIRKKSITPAEAPQYGMLYITASKEGYAPWTTTIALDY